MRHRISFCGSILCVLAALSACGGAPTGAANQDSVPAAPRLANLVFASSQPAPLRPAFEQGITDFAVDVPLGVESTTVTATAVDPAARVDIASVASGTGVASGTVALALGTTEVTVTVTADGGATASYVVRVTRGGELAQQAYLKASNTDAYDFFGSTLALSGDTLAVGAFGEDSKAVGSGGDQSDNTARSAGAVYVFTRSAGVWTQEAYLKASNTDSSDNFGWSVALSGDTLAVGAARETSNAVGSGGDQSDNSAREAGAVYVFTRSAGVWTQEAYLKASNTDSSDIFGSTLALSGDTLAVGAIGEASNAVGSGGDQSDNSAPYAGAVYVFTRSAGVWSQEAYLKASNTDTSDTFGSTLALSGDTLAVGAERESSKAVGSGGDQSDNGVGNAGAVYVFTRSAGVWTQEAYLKASNTEAGDHFGVSVALSGNTLAVGAGREASKAVGSGGDQSDNSARNAGAVYVFTRSAGVWTQEAYLKASNTNAYDFFGSTLALSGDTLAVGAFGEASNAVGSGGDQGDNSAEAAGAAYVFTRSAGVWTQRAYLKASNTDEEDSFGTYVALSGNTLAVGAQGERSNAVGSGGDQSDNSAEEAGAVYVFAPALRGVTVQ